MKLRLLKFKTKHKYYLTYKIKLRKLRDNHKLDYKNVSMARALCLRCQRPEIACICHLIVALDNKIEVVVLQHPTEVSQAKGTVTLLHQSLNLSQVLVGEDFSQDENFTHLLAKYAGKLALLYPSENAIEVDYLSNDKLISKNANINLMTEIRCIIILDGTWKKAYRMFMVNKALQTLPHIVLPQTLQGNYDIRKTKKSHALSSLEACCHALARLENNPGMYQCLLDNFIKFNQFQLSFRQTEQKN